MFLCLASLVLIAANSRDECDLSKVVKGHYCTHDRLALEKSELISGRVYWYCSSCDAGRATEGPCAYCSKTTVKKGAGDNVCPKCFRAVIAADVCVKSYFACPKCGQGAAAAGNCGKCNVALTAKVSRALVKYSCPDCGKSTNTAGRCNDPDCTSKGKDLKRKCMESGKFPHVGAK